MAGVKDEKSFYKKYPTEAAFLKAHPKAKAELKKFANGGQMNAQSMQQFAGGGVWGDIKEYAGIAAQFSDLAGIGYGEKIRRETDQEGVAFGEKFGDTMASGVQGVTKGALNVLPGGSMVTGLTDQTNSAINKPEYNEDGSLKQLYEGRTKLQKTSGGVGEVVGAVGAGVFTGNVGGATSSGMQGFGKFSEGMDTDSFGERKNSNWATAANTSNSLSSLAGMVGGQFNMNPNSYGFKNSMKTGITTNAGNSSINLSNPTNMGKTQFGLAKYGGQMQYAMGGEIQYANGGTGEINAEVEGGGYGQDGENAIGPNGQFTQFNGPTHAQGGIQTDMAPGTRIFSDKLKAPGTNKSFAELNKVNDTVKLEKKFAKLPQNTYTNNSKNVQEMGMLKSSDMLFAMQEQLKKDKVAAYAKKMGVTLPQPLIDNEQMEPQGMPEQSEGEISMAMHGGMMNYMAKGGMIKRADGSYSKRGLWDNIRANAGSGKAPTKEMLEQEAKINSYQVGGLNDRMNYTTRNLDNNSYNSYRKINTETGPRFYNSSSPDLSTANKMIDFKIRNNQSDSIPMNQIPQNVITNFKNYQVGGNTDAGKLSDIQRQLKVVKQQISTLQPDSSFVSGPLAKLRGLEKDLTIRQNNHPEFKKAMGGRLPMYQMAGWNTNFANNSNIVHPNQITNIQTNQGIPYASSAYIEPKYNVDNSITPSYRMNEIDEGNPSLGQLSNDKEAQRHLPSYYPVPPKVEGEGFDWANAGKQVGQFALQNAGNLYDLYRSTQDNSKLNLARYSPTLLDKTQDLANNQRMYSEGKRQTAEASQGIASTYLNNMYANRASKLASDLNVNTTYDNLNAQIANAAKLYNAGAIDKETMFKLQAEGMNRNLKGQALSGMSQNFLNQGLTNDKNKMDQKTLDFYTKYYNDASFKKMVDENFKDKKPKTK